MRRLLITLAVIGVAATGCSPSGERPATTALRSPTTGPATTSVATTSAVTTSPVTTPAGVTVDPSLVAAPLNVPTSIATVLRVIDGDSLEVEIDGVVEELRLVGINAPEGGECHGDASRDTLDSIVAAAGGTVDLAEGEDGRDQFGRLLGYISSEGIDINALLLATGNALALQSGHERQTRYLPLTDTAFADGAGMWEFGVCGPATIDEHDVTIVAFDPDPPGRDEDRLEDEFVVIRNLSDRTVDLGGWTLRDESTAHRYVFPANATIGPGADVFVRVGCGTDDLLTRYWCNTSPVWSNSGDSIVLLDASGNVIDLLVYRS